VTVSLDSQEDAVFRAVGVPLARVLEGIAAAHETGLWPVKLNTVVERGVNDHGLVDLAPLRPRQRPDRTVHRIHGRGHNHGWRLDDVVPAAEVIRRIDAELPSRGGSPC
jgi:cyclic pyranopterin phosphate synthase